MEGGIDDTDVLAGVSMSVNRSNSAPSAGQAVTGLCPIFVPLNRDLWWWSSAFLTLRSEQNFFVHYLQCNFYLFAGTETTSYTD